MIFIHSFLFYWLLLNRSFQTNSNSITNCFKIILFQLQLHCSCVALGRASSDVLFIFDDATEIHAHRLILSHRSTFFQTLLDNEARSSNQLSYGNSRQPLRVRIKDIERAVFMEIIRYIYCGHVR